MKRKKSLWAIIIAIIFFIACSGTIINNNVIKIQKQEKQEAYNVYDSEQALKNDEYENGENTVHPEGIASLECNAYFLDEFGNRKRGIYQKFTPGTIEDISNPGDLADQLVTLHVQFGLSADSGISRSIKNGQIKLTGDNYSIAVKTDVDGYIKSVSSDGKTILLNEISGAYSEPIPFRLKQNVLPGDGHAYKDNYTGDNTVIFSGEYVDEENNQSTHFECPIEWKLDWDLNTEISSLEMENKVNEIDSSKSVILLNDKRIAVVSEVNSWNDASGAIPVVSENRLSNLVLNVEGEVIRPETVTVTGGKVDYQSYTIEAAKWDGDVYTWKTVRDNAGDGQYVSYQFKTNVIAIYPSSLYEKYLEGKTATIEQTLQLETQNKAFVNPKIKHTEQSILTNKEPENGFRYTEKMTESLTIHLDSYTGELYRYIHNIVEQNKPNSELIYYGINASAGYKETSEVTVYVGGGIVDGVMIKWDNNNPSEHSFRDTNGDPDNNLYSHEDFKYYTGIRIRDDAVKCLGDNGWVDVYDDSNNKLIKRCEIKEIKDAQEGEEVKDGTFRFQNKYKKIRIETSPVQNPGTVVIHSFVELDNQKLKEKYPDKATFDKFNKLEASSHAYIKLQNASEYSLEGYAGNASVDYLNAGLKLWVDGPIQASMYKPTRISYAATIVLSDYYEDQSSGSMTYLKNPSILVEFPKAVSKANLVEGSLNITIGDRKVNDGDITIEHLTNQYGQDYFKIKVIGESQGIEHLNIKASFDTVPNTELIKKSTDMKERQIRTFANTTYNGKDVIGNVCLVSTGGHGDSVTDIYDWNGNGSVDDIYDCYRTDIEYGTPVGIGTETTINLEGTDIEYSNTELLNIDKEEDKGKTVIVHNYVWDNIENEDGGTVKNLRVIGKIPFRGNQYLKEDGDMGSTFDTTMCSGIAIPDNIPANLKGQITIKYSTDDINIIDHKSVSDIEKYTWSNTFTQDTKSYMIDFGDNIIDKGLSCDFTYKVKLPDTLDYGTASYTSDAILFNIVSEGILDFQIPVESAKAGISVTSPYTVNLEFIKVDKDNTTEKLTGAKYKLTRVDGNQIKQGDEWVDFVELGSDTETSFTASGLYPGIEYKLEETQAPTNYKKQNVTFRITSTDNKNISIEVTSGELGKGTQERSNNGVIEYKVEIPDELDNANYKVKYLYENVDGTYSENAKRPMSEPRSGIIGKSATVEESDKNPNVNGIANYTLNTKKNEKWSQAVTADGKTVLEVYFDLNGANYKVKYLYENADGTYSENAKRPMSEARSGKVGVSVAVEESDKNPNVNGIANYTLNTEKNEKWSQTVTADGKTVLEVYFDLNSANYKVKYLYENADGTYSENAKRPMSDARSGIIGKLATIEESDKNPNVSGITNYVLNTEKNEKWSQTVTADGKTVLEVYFDLNSANYKVKYLYENADGTYSENAKRPMSEARSGKVGVSVAVEESDKNPNVNGIANYTLNTKKNEKWSQAVTADGKTVLEVYFDLNSANYKVKYLYENADGTYSENAKRPMSDARSGIIGKLATIEETDKNPNVNGITNYALNTKKNEKWSQTVTADGRTVLEVYFDLNMTKYNVEYYYQNVSGTYDKSTTRTTPAREGIIGETVTVTDDDKDPKDISYELSSHNESERAAEVKADGSTVLKVYFDLKYANYNVEYYYQNSDGSYSQKQSRRPVTRQDKIGATVTVTDDDKEPLFDEYELSTTHDTKEQTGVVRAGNSTVLRVYFDLNKVKYSVEYYFMNDNGRYPVDYTSKVDGDPVIVGTEIRRSNVNLDPTKVNGKPNGAFLLDDEDQITTERTSSRLVVTTNESENVFKVYFSKGYTVTYKPGNKGTFDEKSRAEIPYGTNTPLLVTNKTGAPGYTFTGWMEEVNGNVEDPLLQDGTIGQTPLIHDTTYVAQWKPNENTPYKVEFYYQEDGKYPNTPFATVNRTATTDTTVNLTVPSKVNDLTVKVTDSKATDEDISRPKTGANYVYDTKAANVITHNVDGDGSAVLKVYFKQIPVRYNVDAVLKDTGDKTLTRNQFTITRAGTNSDPVTIWNKKAISESVEVNEENLLIDTYTYNITENEAPNEKYVNVLNGRYVSVVVAISDEGKPTISSYTVHNNDGTEVDKNDSVYSYLDVNLGKVDNVDTIKVKVINPVRFTFEVEKRDSEGNSLENTGISIKSDIINEQNAAHRAEIESESKNGLQITENGVVTGETNENGVVKYEETWVNTNEYTYEITETATSGNQYVNVLDGYKIQVRVKVNADGTLEIVKNGNRNYTIVATEAGKKVTDDLYDYVKITVSSNSLKAIIDNTGHVNVDITNPVKFNFDLVKLDSDGNSLPGTRFSVTKEGQSAPLFDNREVTDAIEIEENPINAGEYTYYIREEQTASSRYTNILDNKYIKLVLRVDGDGNVDVVSQDGDEFKVFTENKQEVYDYDNILKFIKVVKSVNNDVCTISLRVTNPVGYKVDIETRDTTDTFLDKTNVTIQRENVTVYDADAIQTVEVDESSIEAGVYNYYITQNTTKDNKYVNPLEGKFVKAEVRVNTDGTLEINKTEIYEGVIGSNYIKLVDSSELRNYISVDVNNNEDVSRLNIIIKDPVRFTVELKKLDTEGNGVQDTNITIKSQIVDEQNASHSNEIYTESKDGLNITDSGEVSGATNGNGTVKYEETWVNAKEYVYEITEEAAAGNQFVNILDGFKVVVRVRVSADGTLSIVKDGNRNYSVVATETGKVFSDDMYEYITVDVENNSLSAVISQTGKLNVEITNPVRFYLDIEKKDTTGNDINGAKFTIEREDLKDPLFNKKEVTTDIEVKEDPIKAGRYIYFIRENSTATKKYENILENRYIKLILDVKGNGHVDIEEQDGKPFKVYDKLGAEITDENVLDFIEVWPDVADNGDEKGISTIKVKVTNPVKYNLNVTTATTAYDENKNIDEYFLDKTDVIIYRNDKDIYNGQPVKDTELTETPIRAGTYEYYFTQASTKNDKFVNPLENKFVKATITVSPDGRLTLDSTELFEGTIGDQYVRRVTDDEAEKYFKINVNNDSDVSMIDILIIDPVRFSVEVKKVDTDNKPVENTNITVKSPVVESQDAVHKDEVIETSKSKDGIDITTEGDVAGTTNQEGVVKFEETWVESNESSKVSGDFYTYEITEDEAAGNQYVNVLEGYKVIVRLHVDPNGSITLVDKSGRAYNKNTKIKYTIVKIADGSEVPTTDIAYEYVTVNIESNSVNAIISGTDELKVDITNPVRFNFNITKKSTDDKFLSGTNFTVSRDKRDTPLFEGEPTENIEFAEDPINSGVYTYYIRENQTNKSAGDRYVNVLDGKYIKLRVKVNANGVIDILDENSNNSDYFEVYEESGNRVTDDDVLRYITVHSADGDEDGVYTLDVNVKNPVKYEIDIITLDTLNNFLNNVNVSLYKVVNTENRELYRDNATDVNKVQRVEKLEIPADSGTYTYYVKENSAPTERYINVLNNRYIEITLTVAANGMLTETHRLCEGELGKGTEVTSGEVLTRFEVSADNTKDVSRLNITIVNPVRFTVEVDKYDTAENPLTGTTFEIESPIIESQKYEHNNEKINGIDDDGITEDGTVTGVTENAIEKSKDGSMQRARISYEETWVDANANNGFYTYYIRETKTAGAQYVNMLEGHRVVVRARVGADGKLELVDKNGTAYKKDAEFKYTIETEDGVEISDTNNEMYRYVSINVSDSKILATLNAEVINPVRYNIAVYETIYGDEKVKLRNIPVEINSEFSGITTLVTDENGYNSMEERAVWADTYTYRITQLNEYNGVKVEDEFVNILDGYYIGIDLNVHGDGVIKTMSADGDETTVSYKLYKKDVNGDYVEVDFKDTMIDDFVKVKVTTAEDNVCTLNVWIITPEKYDFKLEKTDIDVLHSVTTYPDKYPEVSPNMNDVEFTVTVRDANGEVVLKDAVSGRTAKTEFDKIDTKSQKTARIDEVDGLLKFQNILIERQGTYTFEISEVTPIVEGMIYKDKSESIILKAEIVVENGKYVLKNMTTEQAERYTIKENTKLTGNETQTVNVNVTNERIKGKYDLFLNKINKYTELPLDGAVYKVTVEQEGKEEKVLYLSNDDVLSKEVLIPYEEEESSSAEGVTSFKDIRIELPETYTIKIEELKAPVVETEDGKKITFTKLDDVIELEVTTAIQGEFDDAHYVLEGIKLKEGNHDLISETHSKAEDDKQNINVQIKNEYFDLALRQYVTNVNGTEITSRKPTVKLDKFHTAEETTAEYIMDKSTPQRAYAGQEVIYTIEVFNEGIIDGYAEEIMEYLPEGLEFVDDDFNKEYGWKMNDDNSGVVTRILSKEANEENLIPAYDKETKTLSSISIKLKLRVKDNVKLKTILTTIAEITDSLANDRKETVDRDSYDLVTLPMGDDLVEYAENQEDDDDYEKLIIEEFDLAPVKYTKAINGEEQTNRAPEPNFDKERAEEYRQGVFNGFQYKKESEMPRVEQADRVVFGINVYNEGSVGSYAEEVTDIIEQGFLFVKDSEINKKYGWRMLDAEGNETDDATKAKSIVTDYLSRAKETNERINVMKPLEIVDGKVVIDSKYLEAEFEIIEPISKDRIIENKVIVSKFIDDQDINVKDRDEQERLEENIEKLYVKIFDLELNQVINSIEVKNTKTNEVTVVNSDDIRKLAKVDIARSKLKFTNIKVEYLITIKNNGETSGYATEIKDYVPQGLTFDANDNQGWSKAEDGVITTNLLENELMNPGETREIKLVLRWNGAEKVGQKRNVSEISRHANSRKQDYIKDMDSTPDNLNMEEDDIDVTELIISIKTGSAEIMIATGALGFMIIVSLGIAGYNRKRARK